MALLTIPDEPTQVTYTVTTANSAFPFPFAVFDKSDLRILKDGVALPQSSFTMSGTLLEGGGYQGGTVVLNNPAENCELRVSRRVRPVRATNFSPSASIPVRSIDMALNRLTAQQQDTMQAVADAEAGLIDPDIVQQAVDAASAGVIDGLAKRDAGNLTPSDVTAFKAKLGLGSSGTNLGEWNAATNTPLLASGVGADNSFYTVSVAGTTTLDGVAEWGVGDRAVFTGGAWTKDTSGGAGKANSDGGNLTAPQAASFRKKLKIDIFTPEDEGAVGDGVADDTAAIKAAILKRRAAGGVLKLARKKYRITSPIVDYGDYLTWTGDQAVLVWDGATTGDMVTFGQAGAELRFPSITGLKVVTKKIMTSGWMVVCHAPARGVLRDIVIQGIDAATDFGGRPCNGIYFNGYSYTSVQRIETGGTAGAQTAIGIRGIPMGAQAGLFFEGGNRISGFDYGIRYGGGNGGVYFDQTDVIGNLTANVLHDNSYEAQHNREIFWSSTCSIDSGSSLGCYVIDQNGGGPSLIVFDKTWICSAQGTLAGAGGAPGFGAGLYLKRGPDVRLMGDVYLHNHGGDAFRCDEPECDVKLTGFIQNNKGYGVNRTAASMRVNCAGVVFTQNLLGDQRETYAPVGDINHDRIRARNIRVKDGGSVRLDSGFYLYSNAGVDPFVNFDPSTYHRWNRSTREHEFSSDGVDSLLLHQNYFNPGGAGFMAYKVLTGTTNGSGAASVAHSISSLQARIVMANAFVTQVGGDVAGHNVNCDGTNVFFSGATASRPFRVCILYRRDAM